MSRSILRCAILTLTGLGLVTPAAAVVPQRIGFLGVLTNAGGEPVEASLPMTFRMYGMASGGSPLWEEKLAAVMVTGGVFEVELGASTPIAPRLVSATGDLWLSVTVDEDSEMEPRQRISSVPYALRAGVADQVTGTSLDGLGCAAGQIPIVQSSGWACASSSSLPGHDSLAGLTCATNAVATWDGANWTCRVGVTGVTAGAGLTGGGSSGTVTLAVDATSLQRRVSGGCAFGNCIRQVNQDGSVSCEAAGGTSANCSSQNTCGQVFVNASGNSDNVLYTGVPTGGAADPLNWGDSGVGLLRSAQTWTATNSFSVAGANAIAIDASVTDAAGYAARLAGGKLHLPVLSTASQPSSGVAGDVYYNADDNRVREFVASSGGYWRSLRPVVLLSYADPGPFVVPNAWAAVDTATAVLVTTPGFYVLALSIVDVATSANMGVRLRDTTSGITRASAALHSASRNAVSATIAYEKTTTTQERLEVQWAGAVSTTAPTVSVAGQSLNVLNLLLTYYPK